MRLLLLPFLLEAMMGEEEEMGAGAVMEAGAVVVDVEVVGGDYGGWR